MLVFRRQSKSTGHKCEGLQIYSTVTQLMYTSIYESRKFESLVTYSEVRNLQLFMNYIGGLTLLRA